ncbi:MAG: hypothetical protein AAF585_26650, partial [Verrucomicrobiota bacterium]
MKRLVFLLFAGLLGLASAEVVKLEYAPSPVDNPLKGLVPYVTSDAVDRFPHSVEFYYFPLRKLLVGPESFDWSPIEKTLAITQKRGVQLTFRVYMEFPGKENAIPQFLINGGLKVTKWTSEESDGGVIHTPNYEDPQLRAALKRFIAAFGEKYDNDPRVAWVTAGLLGLWGEWHTYPREDLWASFDVQNEVLDAYEAAFKKTPILLRYPAKDGHYAQAANHKRRFGYHDDSFGYATLDTGREEDSWFFIPLLKEAEALEKWKTEPIGGEIRPELWKRSFTNQPHKRAQNFQQCVEETHVTWLMDSGLFEKRFPLPDSRRERALDEVRRLGYEFHVSEASYPKRRTSSNARSRRESGSGNRFSKSPESIS